MLLGTLFRDGDTLQVNAQLVEAAASTVLWSERLTVDWSNIFQVQENLATRIVESLAVPLTSTEAHMVGRDLRASARAYELYLRARQLDQQANTTSEWRVARDMYLRAVEEDPTYALAWARLGRIHRVVAKFISGSAAALDAGYSVAERAFEKAFACNPDLDVAHNLYTGLELERGNGQEAMLRLLSRVRDSGGTADLFSGLVAACRYCGLLEASIAADRQATRLDPLVSTSVDITLAFMGRFDDVFSHPKQDVVSNLMKAESLIRLGRVTEALALLDQGDTEDKSFKPHSDYRRVLAGRDGGDQRLLPHLRISGKMPDPEVHYVNASGTAMLGVHDTALANLKRAIDGGHFCYPSIASDPWFDTLRRDQEFVRLQRVAESKHRAARVAFLDGSGERLLGT